MYEWIGALISALAVTAVTVLKALFGTNKPQQTMVEHAKPDVEVDDGKDDEERLKDLGL